ncbi:TonB-dependent receptor [Shewanella dokdonensis]|uniref:TonB-dependent receptor n=1 Tax=Shewanella dokdonensis TaxID=712036 RepID=A0ABX8DEZ1_9GAMM|nr:TonB-dependent receptor [Shewanella dokdonensis]MCL1073185.1 TonB-dependent receptor [Shewanella dokdonensis]QVK22955.1 TonB-dependent receptor [Shewanella dokdonensis]
MLKTNKITAAVRLSLIAAVSAGSFGIVHTAVAAEQSTAKGGDVERIEVTGSRIKRQDMETASPVTSISADTIVAQGYASVDQLLQDQTSMAGAPIGATTNNGSDGAAQVDLRGMGANRTLVLLNGRRMVNSGSGADSAVDLNAIPVAMIQRVEILKDGASAVYGSDAIAGVVNIITKKDFEGFQFDAKSSSTDKGDGQTYELNGLYGFSTANGGNYTFGAAFAKRNGVIQGDRKWTERGSSSIVPQGEIIGNQLDANGDVVLDKDGDPEQEMKEYQNGAWVPLEEGYDFTPDSWYQTPSKRYSLFANMTQELGNDLVLTGDFLYTKRKSNQQMAAEPANLYLPVCTDSTTSQCINLTDAMVAGGIVANEKTGKINFRRRTNEVGPRIYGQDTDTYRASLDLQGYLNAGNGLSWDISYTYGKNKAKTWVDNSINATNMKASIYADPDAWFTGNPVNEDIQNDISFTDDARGGNEQHDVQANLSGDLFQLSAGAVSFAIGAEYRYESGYFDPDPVVVAGDSSSAQQYPTNGHYDVISFFQEVSVPFTEKLTGDFAWRYDEYDTFGKASTWKVGLTYRATEDIMLRGVVATGFRAPNVSELFGGNSGSYDYLTDPWGNTFDPQILVNYTSDPNLKPEESESYTAGIVYSPSYLDGFSTTIDYWKFNISDAITRVDVQSKLKACHDGGADAEAACAIINVTPDGDLTTLTSALTNVGSVKTSGVDINIAYKFSGLGLDWSINNDATYLIDYKKDGIDYRGYVDGNMGGYAKWRNNFSVTASQDAWSVMYYNRYISSMLDYDMGDGSEADSVLYHNIVGTYHFTDNLSLSAGVKNFTDEDPSYVSNGSDGGTSPQVYDVVGRQIYGSVSYKF